MKREDMTPVEKAAQTRAKNKKVADDQRASSRATSKLSAAGFSAAQVMALKALFKAS